jgi:hypothetical protein
MKGLSSMWMSVAVVTAICGCGLEDPNRDSTSTEETTSQAVWARCQRSLVTVTAFKAPTGTAAWGTFRAGLTFAYLGESNGRFANWWGPGDPFPGQGTAWINLSQTVQVSPCPF